MMLFSLIIPAYNEEERIGHVIEKYANYYTKKYKDNFELIIVIDGTDNTYSICKDYSKKYKNIMIDYSRKGRGKGNAIIRGFSMAKGDMIGFTDSDESVPPEEFDKLITEADCSIASRRAKGAIINRNQPHTRRFASKAFNLLVNSMFSLDISDTQCGAKVLKKHVMDEILPELRTSGFEFDVELLWRIKKKGYNIEEIPIIWQHNEGSSFSLKKSPEMFKNLIMLRLNTYSQKRA